MVYILKFTFDSSDSTENNFQNWDFSELLQCDARFIDSSVGSFRVFVVSEENPKNWDFSELFDFDTKITATLE